MSAERKYFIHDYETGYPTEVTKEVYDHYTAMKGRFSARMYEQAMPS